MPYKDPEKRKQYHRTWYHTHKDLGQRRADYDAHREEVTAYHRDYYQKHREEILKQKKACYAVHKDEHKQYSKDYYLAHREETLIRASRNQQKKKATIMAHYCGGRPKCAICGETDLRVLQIDHIDGGGAAHRRSLGRLGGYQFYSWLERNSYPKEYQVLCPTCHVRKTHKGLLITEEEILECSKV